MKRLCAGAALIALLAASIYAPAQETAVREMEISIRLEGMFHSQIMRTLHFFTDVYGPRLTGSPNLRAAQEWALEQMRIWGLKNAHLESWEFGRPGWTNDRLSARVISPYKRRVICEVLAWTPGTNGVVTGEAYLLELPAKPTTDDLIHFLEVRRGSVRGKVVFVGEAETIPVTISPSPRRREDARVRAMFDPEAEPMQPDAPAQKTPDPSRLTPDQITETVDAFLVTNQALVKVMDAGREHLQVRALAARDYDLDRHIPTVVFSNEDYGRICRVLADSTPVRLEFDIANQVHPDGSSAYNAVAEIPGTDRADEVIMLGAHLDSWHAATGATDNAIGCSVMMEAARILSALGVKPRRTVRIALWGGEEQGLLGSQAYVAQHFGTHEHPKAAYYKFGGYINMDSGTGKARGYTIFGDVKTAAALREILAPFADLGVVGAASTKSRRLGSTDSTSFNAAGLPGISITQDPIEYISDTWHTNLDLYERIIEDDAKASAVSITAVAYHLAMRDELLPRLAADEMPGPER